MFTYRIGNRSKTLSTLGIVNDRTAELLELAGWKRTGDFLGLWIDPRSGQMYAISQAEAIRRDRLLPRYHFRQNA